jgi:hypothetical protein
VLLRPYLIYRFPELETVNGQPVTQDDHGLAKTVFQNFDKTLAERQGMQLRNPAEESDDFACTYISGTIIPHAIRLHDKLEAVNSMWDHLVANVVRTSLAERG